MTQVIEHPIAQSKNWKVGIDYPEWGNNEFYLQTIQGGYLIKDETPRDAYNRVASTAAKYLKKPELEAKFFNIIWKGWLALSTPVLSNFGTDRGLPISCFGSFVSDSLYEINRKNMEIAILSKSGGGTSANFSSVRAAGSSISGGGTTDGIIPFLKQLDSTVKASKQLPVRRGACAVYIDIEHSDYKDFLLIRRGQGDPDRQQMRLHQGSIISDKFMTDMLAGDKRKRELWTETMKWRIERGEPYMTFIDNANNQAWWKGILDIPSIKNPQLCITGDQRVVTSFGYLTAKELNGLDTELELFDGNQMVKASKMKLREKSADVYKITLDNGLEHKVTSYHGIPVLDKNNNIVKVECKNLKLGDRVAIQTNKGLFGTLDRQAEAFLLGLYQSDGTQYKDIIMLDVWENDFDLLEEIQEKFNYVHYEYGCDTYIGSNQFEGTFKANLKPAKFHDCQVREGSHSKKRLSSKTLKKALNFEKGYVPSWIWESNEATQWEYIRGLLYADGMVFKSSSKGEPIQISYADINREFLQELQLIFNNLGLQSSIRVLKEKRQELLPDGKGGQKYYECKKCWKLIIGTKPNALEVEKHTGFLSRKGIVLEDREYLDNSKKSYKVVGLEYIGKEEVYCPTVESEDHIFVANGFKTFNCNEIFLPSDKDHTYVCCLSSLNLLKWDDYKDTDTIQLSIWFLDAVIEEFIDKAQHIKGIEDAVRFAIKSRAVGLGKL